MPREMKALFLALCLFLASIPTLSGQHHETVIIGEQEWMKRNLNIGADSSYCYKNIPENCRIFGRLYNWETALTICPSGFRLPTDEDWTVLTGAVGGLDVAGYRLLAGGNTGFDVLLGGNYNPVSDIFSYQFRNAYFWTSTPFSETAAWMRHFVNEKTNINRSTVKKHYHFSVRCIRE
jgi:uncharacterized protein (TIGR02145 family)